MSSHTISLQLGGTEPDTKKVKEMESRISRTQEPIPNHAASRKVEVYDFSLSAKIPTEQWTTSWFLLNFMGRETKDMIISPTGGIAVTHYYKPVKELVRDIGFSGGYIGEEGSHNRCKHTDEDTERYWLLENDFFKKELIEKGWMIFPQIEKVDEHEQKKLGVDSSYLYKRSFFLKDFLRTLEMTNHNNVDYSRIIKDFNELTSFGDNMDFVYQGGGHGGLSNFFHMPVRYNNEEFTLKLDGYDSIINQEKKTGNLERKIFLDFDFEIHNNSWWTHEMSKRTAQVTGSYLEKRGIKGSVFFSEDKKNLKCEIRNRSYLKQEISDIGTGELLGQAFDVRQIVKSLIKAEEEYYEGQQAIIMQKRKDSLGITGKTN